MGWFRNLKISVKLYFGFFLMAALLVFIGYFGLSSIDKMSDSMSDMYDNNLVTVRDISAASGLYQRIRVNIRDMEIMDDNKAVRDDYNQKINSFISEVESNINQYQATKLTSREEELLATLGPAWDAFKQDLDEAKALIYEDKTDEFFALLRGELDKSGDTVMGIIEQLVAVNVELAEERNAQAGQLYLDSRNITFIVLVLSVLLGVAFSVILSRSISSPLQRVVKLVERVSKGDLTETTEVDSKDEIGRLTSSTNDMILSLRSIVGGVLTTAEGVSAAAQQISASTEEIAGGSAGQAHAAQTINELFKELSAATHAVARIAEQASDISDDTMNIAEQGGKVVRSSVEGMNQVNVQVARLEEDSNKIGEIIEVIDDIAEQTNLLALNAAIEAARAGDQGRGFAVVADEVRKLAERSGEATKQITDIIKGMQENTRHSVKATRDGVALTKQTGEAFEHIMTKINESAGKVTEIAAASEQQAAQSAEVMAAVENISAVTEESAASCEETASAAQSLAGLAEELNHTVSVFKVNS
ncbi:methyl-accepting chemotaxis protein [Fontibacillus sp. BL9]|uniref:methyl-accepting chemotaxis protein n=1 Tax=Fontibacillus sp. BL9 TaxID=3389971 RepID=UPI003979B65A